MRKRTLRRLHRVQDTFVPLDTAASQEDTESGTCYNGAHWNRRMCDGEIGGTLALCMAAEGQKVRHYGRRQESRSDR